MTLQHDGGLGVSAEAKWGEDLPYPCARTFFRYRNGHHAPFALRRPAAARWHFPEERPQQGFRLCGHYGGHIQRRLAVRPLGFAIAVIVEAGLGALLLIGYRVRIAALGLVICASSRRFLSTTISPTRTR